VRNLTRLFLIAAVATLFAQSARVQLDVVNAELVQQRLEMVKPDVHARRDTLEALFREVGCAELTQQKVPGSKEPNVLCSLPAQNDGARTIVVGAHFDYASIGTGAVDDWSGAALLPSLYQSLAKHPRRHRFVFAGFAAEETGLNGSREYVKKLGKEGRPTVAAMVNLECLGLGAPTIWLSRTDTELNKLYVGVAQTLGLKPGGVNMDKVGDDDTHPFKDAKIPVISIHSITQETFPILHSKNDTLKAIDPKHYNDAYRLASLYLAYIDSALDRQ
jgi:hypothetical protein